MKGFEIFGCHCLEDFMLCKNTVLYIYYSTVHVCYMCNYFVCLFIACWMSLEIMAAFRRDVMIRTSTSMPEEVPKLQIKRWRDISVERVESPGWLYTPKEKTNTKIP